MLIFLVGMMGSGKTTIGKMLSYEWQLPFYDTDDIISSIEGLSVSEIFEKHGEDYFRTLEKELILSWKMTNCIVATGGGLPCIEGVMDVLNAKGKVIYLNTKPAILAERLSDDVHRPLIMNLSKKEKEQKLKEILQQREVFYKAAKVKIVNNGDPAETVAKILSKVKKK
jgi:shikimate kinase